MAGCVRVIWVSREAEYFCGRDWTGQITLKLLAKIDLSRKSPFAPAIFEREEEGRTADCSSAPVTRGGALKNIGCAQGPDAN